MRLEHEQVEHLKGEIKRIVGKRLDLTQYQLFFFGSRVSGRGDEHSDIDIGIEGKEPIPSLTRSKIEEDIENLPILYKIDFVDFKTVSEDFYRIAKQTIEPIE
ncbi:MAG: nucleotidyltransferase domain-containing protein [bacterium]|nr:nucleotidyltransferase domain-containing protein [bacterium]